MLQNTKSSMIVDPLHRAKFATAARLLCSLVTESLIRGLYVPIRHSEAEYTCGDVLAIAPLWNIPVIEQPVDCDKPPGVLLLDPMDMMPVIFGLSDIQKTDQEVMQHRDLCRSICDALTNHNLCESATVHISKDPIELWARYATDSKLSNKLYEEIAEELRSCIKWQAHSYAYPPASPNFHNPSIDWEQSIVEGHPTHPMHKMRRFLWPIPDLQPGTYDLYHPNVRFISIPQDNLRITFDFQRLVDPILILASNNAGQKLVTPDGFVTIPVHEIQIYHIQDKFPDAIIHPSTFHVRAFAQQSIRSIIIPEGYPGLSLKLAVGIKLTSAVRTISPESAYLGPRFSAQVEPKLIIDRNILTVARELASVIHNHPDKDIAKHCAAIIRDAYENFGEANHERLIVCTSLVERGHSGEDGHIPPVIRIFNLDCESKRVAWLDRFVSLFFKAFLPPVIHNGVAFECHPQNCVARFDLHSRELLGFIVRDFGGIRVHPQTLKASTGVDIDFLDGHSIIAPDLEDVYTRMYHTVFHNHLQQLIRVLGLHYNGLGWRIVRTHLDSSIPHEHGLYNTWMSPNARTLPGKCFMRMRIQGMYRFHLHAPFPNLIHYRGIIADDDQTQE